MTLEERNENLEVEEVFSVNHLSYEIGEKRILSEVNFKVVKGEIVVVIGESGVGKSTLLKLLSGLVAPSSGEIMFRGKPLDGPRNLIPGNAKITRIAQDFELMPSVLAVENIYQNALHLADDRKEVLASALLNLFGLNEVRGQVTKTLSGGEQQRLAIAKAMAAKKEVLLFDEVFSQLDLGTKASILTSLKRYIKEKKRTALFVLHDPHDAFYLADRVLVLQGGTLVQSGLLLDVYTYSVSSKVAALFGLVNKMSVKKAKALFPDKWQNFNRKNQRVWFRPNAVKPIDLAEQYEVIDSFATATASFQLHRIDRTEIWLEV